MAALGRGGEFVAAERFHAGRRPGRVHFANEAANFIHAGPGHGRGVDRGTAGEQFVKQNAQRVDVTARVDIQPAEAGLLRTHVHRGADELFEACEKRLVRELALRGLGDAEVDHLGHRHAVVQRHEDVRRLDVPVDDPLLVRVLNRLTDLDEQIEPLLGGEIRLVAVIRDPAALDPFHDEVRAARGE